MTLDDIRSAAAGYLHKATSDFTVNGVDLSLFALNQVRMSAELLNDLNFTRKLVQLSVDGVTGGSLSAAVEYGTLAPVEVKSIVDVGQFDSDGNLRPVEWTTVAAGLDVQRSEAVNLFRYPTDAQASTVIGMSRVTFSGDKVYLFPKVVGQPPFVLGIEAYTFTPDWVATDYQSVFSPWTVKGAQYLQWMLVVHLNQVFKDFVFRQEGNLPPPQTLADQGLMNLVTWDTFKYEQRRRHNR